MHPGLEKYLLDWGNTWLLRNIYWMPNFGQNSRAPVFLTTRAKTRFDLLLSKSPQHRTWYHSWAEKCFSSVHPQVGDFTDRIYSVVLRDLVREGIVKELQVKNDRIWGIEPEVFRITTDVSQFRCNQCGHNASIAESEKHLWVDAPCLRFHCYGRYQEEKIRPDYVFPVDTFVSSAGPLDNHRFGCLPLGQGAVIRAIDSSTISPHQAWQKVVQIAAKKGLPLQWGNTRGGNDGSAFMLQGAVNIPLSWPGLYSHSFIEKIHRFDLETLTNLIIALVEEF